MYGPYCGVYCVAAALETLGQEPPMEKLLAPSYVGSELGSSLEELERAVRHLGGHGAPMSRLTVDALRSAKEPIILHFTARGRSATYNHWVLFLGMHDGRARIYDPPDAVEEFTLAEVLSRWDGTGLVVSARPINDDEIVWTVRASFATWLALAACLAAVVRFAGNWLPQESRQGHRYLRHIRDGFLGVALIGTLSAAFAVSYHAMAPTGFLRNRQAVASVVEAYLPTLLPKIALEDLRPLVASKQVVVVDARPPWAFDLGHIDGAINVRVTATAGQRRRALAGIARTTPLIVYCQGPNCQWDEEVAAGLVADGFADVRLFPGGWVTWSGQQPP
jgi:rhodanese-related sulfurtransferase